MRAALPLLYQVRFENVDIVAPGGTCCVSELSFAVQPNKPLIVTGPNGSGKSSLFRVLGGLWEIPEGGRVYRPCKQEDSEQETGSDIQVFLVPQKPYHSNGSLADQITYPHCIPSHERSAELEGKLLDLLRLVEVENLIERWSWHDARVVKKLSVSEVRLRSQRQCKLTPIVTRLHC